MKYFVFSLISVMFPVLASYTPIVSGIFIFLSYLACCWLGICVPVLGLPTFVATLVWHSYTRKYNRYYCLSLVVAIFSSSTLLFMLHPVGQSAYLYTLLWFLPLVVSIVSFLLHKRVMDIQIGMLSTYSAHALGSVFYLYTYPTTASFWIHLIPWVVIERFTFALIMVVLYNVVCKRREVCVTLQ